MKNSEAKIAQKTLTFSMGAATFSVLAGCVGLFGWFLDVETLKSLVPGLPRMSPNTAVLLVMAGFSLFLAHRKETFSETEKLISRILSGFIFFVALLKLAEYSIGWSVNIDGLLVNSQDSFMSPHTAIAFVLIGMALFILDTKQNMFFNSQNLSVIAGFMALLALMGYLYEIRNLYSIAYNNGMAVHTALGVAALSLGVLFSRCSSGWISLLSCRNSGGYIARRLLPVAILLPFMSEWVIFSGVKAGIYSEEFGRLFCPSFNMTFFALVIFFLSKKLDANDIRRTVNETSLKSVHRALKTLSDFNIAITKSPDEQTLLQKSCDIIVESGGYRMAWIGSVEHDDYKSVLPVAKAGHEDGYLANAKITWADTERGRGPTGRAIRSSSPVICRDIVSDDNFLPWRDEAVKRGYGSIISIPLEASQGCQRVLNIYALEKDAFHENEVALLKELSENLTFGINSIRTNMENNKIITERKRLEEQLYHMHRVEAVGQLAGGIAHDFNNLLTAIIVSGALLEIKAKNDKEILKHVNQIITVAEKAATLTKGLLAFSRKQVIEKKPVSVNSVIDEAIKIITRLIGADVDVNVKLLDRDIMILADAGQIEQVLINLATNARDAMPQGGIFQIQAQPAEIERWVKELNGLAENQNYVMITVSDTGEGMSEERKEKIFEPFFTTKDVDKGTGLGLSIVYGIVKQHDGAIDVYSKQGLGSVFNIYLPIASDFAAESVNNAPSHAVRGNSETILLAEDSEDVGVLIKNTLEEFGYRVIFAKDGEEAKRELIKNIDDIQLLILDVIMPKCNGSEVYDLAKALNPSVKTIFTSGYNDDVIHQRGILLDGLHFLPKPYVPSELLKKIREVLDGGSQAREGGIHVFGVDF